MRSVRLTVVCGIFLFSLLGGGSQVTAMQPLQEKLGYASKKPVFGGATETNGWGAIGVVVKEAMKSYGWDVQICSTCAGAARAARLVAAAAVPAKLVAPNYQGPPQPNAPLDFGATGSQFLWWAYQGNHDFAKDPEGARKQLRLVANIQTPSYMFVAVKASLGITDMRQIKEKRIPVGIHATSQGGAITPTILAYYGLTKEALESFGGKMVGNTAEDLKAVDVIIGFGHASGEYQEWLDVNQRFDLKYMELPKDLLTKLAKDFDLEEMDIPVGLFRSIDHPIPTVIRSGTVLYGRDDMPDDFAYTLAKAMDEHQDRLQWVSINYSYNPHTVWKAFGVPLHPGAARYYREKGYMK
jgi:uncharacterized protein